MKETGTLLIGTEIWPFEWERERSNPDRKRLKIKKRVQDPQTGAVPSSHALTRVRAKAQTEKKTNSCFVGNMDCFSSNFPRWLGGC